MSRSFAQEKRVNLTFLFRDYESIEQGALVFIRALTEDAGLDANLKAGVAGAQVLPVVQQYIANFLSITRGVALRERNKNASGTLRSCNIVFGLRLIVKERDISWIDSEMLAGATLAFEMSLQSTVQASGMDPLATLNNYKKAEAYYAVSMYVAGWLLAQMEDTV